MNQKQKTKQKQQVEIPTLLKQQVKTHHNNIPLHVNNNDELIDDNEYNIFQDSTADNTKLSTTIINKTNLPGIPSSSYNKIGGTSTCHMSD